MQPDAVASERAPRWRPLLNLLRIAVSVGLIAYLVYRADPAQIWQTWRAVDLRLVGLALLLQLLGIALSAAKWGVLLRARGEAQPYPWLFGMYLVGQFASNFLPTAVGGDAVRAVQLGRRIGSFSEASASIFLERLTGFVALSVLANVALALAALQPTPLITTPALRWLSIGFGLVALAVMLASFGAARIERLLGPYLPKVVRGPTQRLATALTTYAPRGGRLLAVLAMSLLFQSLWIALHVVCGLALGLGAPLLIYALISPITDMVGLAPMFVNNLGARELVFTLYLGQVGVAPATAVALALLIFTVKLGVSVLGGLVVAFGGGGIAEGTESLRTLK